MRTFIKILIAVTLVAVYWACGGLNPVTERYLFRLHATFFGVYITGLIFALWLDYSQGDFSLRPVFVAIGCVLMILAFWVMLATKADRQERVNTPDSVAAPRPAGQADGSGILPAVVAGGRRKAALRPRRSTRAFPAGVSELGR